MLEKANSFCMETELIFFTWYRSLSIKGPEKGKIEVLWRVGWSQENRCGKISGCVWLISHSLRILLLFWSITCRNLAQRSLLLDIICMCAVGMQFSLKPPILRALLPHVCHPFQLHLILSQPILAFTVWLLIGVHICCSILQQKDKICYGQGITEGIQGKTLD